MWPLSWMTAAMSNWRDAVEWCDNENFNAISWWSIFGLFSPWKPSTNFAPTPQLIVNGWSWFPSVFQRTGYPNISKNLKEYFEHPRMAENPCELFRILNNILPFLCLETFVCFPECIFEILFLRDSSGCWRMLNITSKSIMVKQNNLEIVILRCIIANKLNGKGQNQMKLI